VLHALDRQGFTLRKGCEFRETSSVLNFLNIIKGTGAANTTDRLVAVDNFWKGLGVTSISSFFLSADALDGVILRRNRIIHEPCGDTSSLLKMTTGACTNLDCGDNVVITKQTACTAGSLLNVGASSTGVVYRNFAGTLLTSGDKLFTTTVGPVPLREPRQRRGRRNGLRHPGGGGSIIARSFCAASTQTSRR
jgi:hypothetical protein